MKIILNTLKWYGLGCLVTFVAFQVMVLGLKMDMLNVATLFQIIAGILLGGLWQLNARQAAKNTKA